MARSWSRRAPCSDRISYSPRLIARPEPTMDMLGKGVALLLLAGIGLLLCTTGCSNSDSSQQFQTYDRLKKETNGAASPTGATSESKESRAEVAQNANAIVAKGP